MNFTAGQLAIEDVVIDKCLHQYEVANPLSISHPKVIDLQIEFIQASFPVVSKLLGKVSFSLLAHSFIEFVDEQYPDPDKLVSEFADFVEASAGADTQSIVAKVAKFEAQIQFLSLKREANKGLLFYIRSLMLSPTKMRIQLSPSAKLLNSEQGEVEIWLANQQSYHVENPVSPAIGQFWILKKTHTGLALTPVSEYHYKFYSHLQPSCSIAELREHYSSQTIFELLLSGPHADVFKIN